MLLVMVTQGVLYVGTAPPAQEEVSIIQNILFSSYCTRDNDCSE